MPARPSSSSHPQSDLAFGHEHADPFRGMAAGSVASTAPVSHSAPVASLSVADQVSATPSVSHPHTPYSVQGKNWDATPAYTHDVLNLARDLSTTRLVASLLCQRGYRDTASARAFLKPSLSDIFDPFELTDLKLAAELILNAAHQGKRIVIFGDYDVDGITSCAMMWRFLQQLGARSDTFLPNRMEEGYGLSQKAVERCVAELSPELLIAVDCGTTSVNQVAWLNAQGVTTVVVDHHALPAQLPECAALVNPQRDGKHTYLASVGLVFKVCHGLLKLLPSEQRTIDLKEYLDLVAVGTVADIVPLREDNRVVVRSGLRQIMRTRHAGLRALCEVAGIKSEPTTTDVGFRIGPRLNASGRIGDASRSLQLLKTDDDAEALRISHELDLSNRERQRLEQNTWGEAQKLLDRDYDAERDWVIVLGQPGWHVGVIGIVASRVQKSYHRPAIIIGFDEDGTGKGSGRSIDGYSIVQGLSACASHLVLFGGHDMAAGLTIRQENLDAFRQALLTHARERLNDDLLRPTLQINGIVPAADISEALFRDIHRLAPFGRDNPEPVFLFEGARHKRAPRIFGRNHIKFFLRTTTGECEAIGWSMAQHPVPHDNFTIAGCLDWDEERRRVTLRIIDWREG
ncbi:MAG: single-stranded-DNA-specific exonuclease RecJ [Candidatus Methylacidiphilales bacterium]